MSSLSLEKYYSYSDNYSNYNFDWKIIQGIPCLTTYDAKVCIFQYKLLSNVLYLNQKLYQSRFVFFSKYSTCDRNHRYMYGSIYTILWMHLCSKCIEPIQIISCRKIDLPVLTLQSVIFYFVGVQDQNYLLFNHLLLIFKYNI